MHLSNNDSRHRCIKTFTKQNLDVPEYQFVIHENMNLAEHQMSHKGAAGKAFSAPMPIYIAFFGLTFSAFWRKAGRPFSSYLPSKCKTIFVTGGLYL
jgi:hypothetical protein